MKNEIRSMVCCTVLLFACDGAGGTDTSPGQGSSTEVVEQDLDFEDGSIPEPGPWFDKVSSKLCLMPISHACSDGQIAAIVKASNDGEILVSESVVGRLQTPVARALAQRLIQDHQLANQQLQGTGVEPVSNAISATLTKDAQHHVEKLAALSDDELDSTFLTSELLDHARTLGSLDHLLLPSADDPELLRVLSKIRAAVARHTLVVVEAQEKVTGACGGELPTDVSSDAGTRSDAAATTLDAQSPTPQTPAF
jgi:predicted outer membrane protein